MISSREVQFPSHKIQGVNPPLTRASYKVPKGRPKELLELFFGHEPINSFVDGYKNPGISGYLRCVHRQFKHDREQFLTHIDYFIWSSVHIKHRALHTPEVITQGVEGRLGETTILHRESQLLLLFL